MTTKSDFKDILYSEMLPKVEKPARYTGGEYGSAEIKDAAVSFALAFPDIYEVGMSHLGIKILYGLLNEAENCSCERVFAPRDDMAQQLIIHDAPLYTLETFRPLCEFDIVGFSIQYEMCLTTVLYMLELGRIPLLASERTENDPLVIAGGPCCVNPEPFCDFFDAVIIGEAEEIIIKIADEKEAAKTQGISRTEYLKKISLLDGVYVPSVHCGTDQKNTETVQIKRLFINDLSSSYFPCDVAVPFIEAVHDRAVSEIMRGCPRGCRFCQAGYIYRPARMKSLDAVKKQASELLSRTGYDEVSLSSLSSADYVHCEEAVKYITEEFASGNIRVSLPSLRIDSFSLKLAEETGKVRKSSLTFAPEAGSQKMRDVINKNLSQEQILKTVSEAFEAGYEKLKLYFMIGLPYETDEDVEAVSKLVRAVSDKYYENRKTKRPLSLSVSVSCFVPKPHTPFQFFAQDSREDFVRKQKILFSTMDRRVKLSCHDADLSVLEAVFARGGRELNKVLLSAYKKGCVFDSWRESCRLDLWQEAFSENGINYEQLAQASFGYDEPLPWDFIDIGTDKSYFIAEAEKAEERLPTKNCFEECSQCGISRRYGRCTFEV